MINVKMQPTEVQKLSPKIAVIGVGGGGGNAVDNMISSGLDGCDFLVCNTDAQALESSLSDNKVQLGAAVTGGLGAGSKPEVGKAAAQESMDDVMQYLEGANMAFVTAGMGGGTGTGAAPEIAKACRERGILTIGVVTKPFHFEGAHRMNSAEAGIDELQNYVDTLIVIPNQNLFRIANEKTTFAEAFKMADSVLQSGVRGVTDLMVRPGLVNLDFADVRTAMLEMGKAMMGTGESSGERRAVEAAESAINNPLLDDVSMKGAHGVIINVTGGYDMTLFEADEACNRIRDEVDPNANIIFGATFDESLEGSMRVSIVATGIEKEAIANARSNGGFSRIDATSASTIERAMPNTEKQSDTQPVTDTVAGQAAPTPSVTAAVVSEETKVTAAAITEPEQDMFEQVEFSAQNAMGESAMPQNTALRGTRYKNSFIPPKPMQVEGEAVDAVAVSPDAQQSVLPQPVLIPQTQVEQATVATSSGLQLNPPKMPSPTQKKPTPSLFERITGSVQQAVGGMMDDATQPKTRVAPSATVAGSGTVVPQGGPSQGSLNIEAPSKARKPEDDLDIPAFLRRQAN